MTRKTLFILAGGSLVLFSVLGWMVMHFFGPVSLPQALRYGLTLPLQLLLGLLLGGIIGILAWILVNVPFLKGTRDFFVEIIGPWKLSWMEIVFVSCCAGIGEEIFFRGGIQPLLGIGWTSLLFVLLHGYINPWNAPMTAYGVFMVLAIALLGWVAFEWGLIVAIVAHAVIDVILLYQLSKAYITPDNIPSESKEQ
jgi:membrane protease YdiL (CAAX protease family)